MADFAQYSIITPDGKTFDLGAAGFTVGVGDIQDGVGLPPVEHKVGNLYNSPGGFLRSIQTTPRMVTINATLNADCLTRLHDLRNKLWQSVRWNRTLSNPPDPARLRYTLKGKSADLYVYYSGDVTARVGDSNVAQTVGLRLIAYDPMWYGASTTIQLGPYETITNINNIVEIVSDVGWDNMAGGADNLISAMVIAPDGTLYAGGRFLNIGGGAANYVAKWNGTAWSALGVGMDDRVQALAVAPNGILYAGGRFHNAGGAAALHIAKWIPATSTWSPVGAGLDNNVFALAVTSDGSVYVGGSFHNVSGGGIAVAHIAKWSGTTWSALGIGTDDYVSALVIGPDGSLYAGGEFLLAGGIANTIRIAKWNGTAWSALSTGMNALINALAMTSHGILYAGGNFTTAGIISANYIASWNGTAWTALGSGMNGNVYALSIASNGLLYAGGGFTIAGGLALADRIAVWNGTTWNQVDINLLDIVAVIYSIAVSNTVGYYAFNTFATTAIASKQVANAVTLGDEETFPIFTITGPGILQHIINRESDEKLIFNLYINPGEIITIDLSPGVKSIVSSWPNRPSAMAGLSLPQSSLGTWSLKPEPIAPLGVNTVGTFMTGTTPREYNDNNNQLSGWENITNITCLNVDANGALYVNIVSDGAGFYHVNLYDDAARTHLAGHTATYNGAGNKAIVPDNSSGLGGTVTVDAVVAADADIIVYFATACMTYFDRYLSIDSAVN